MACFPLWVLLGVRQPKMSQATAHYVLFPPPFMKVFLSALRPSWSGIGNRVWFLKELLDCMNVFIIQFQMSKRERKICEFEMDLKNFFICALI